MNDPDRELELRLEALARRIGPLDGFEARVAESIRRIDAAPAAGGRRPLEALVGESLRRAVGRRVSWRRWVGVAAAAAAVLASIETEGGGFEVRPVGEPQWRAPAGQVQFLGPGDEVRAVENRGVRIRLSGGGALVLHPASTLGFERAGAETGHPGIRTFLVQGVLDAEIVAAGPGILVVRAGESECRIDAAQVQVRRAPDRGTLFATYRGRASVTAAGTQRALPAGTGIFVAVGGGTAPRVTSFTLDNGALAELLQEVRARWQYYVRRETRQVSSGQPVVTRWLGSEVETMASGRRGGTKLRIRLARVPFPGTELRENARRFLAAHTEDDRRFATDSLRASLIHGLPEIAGRAVRALLLMGDDAVGLEERVDRAVPGDADEAQQLARMAARAALGQGPALEVIRAALAVHRPLATRALAVLAVAGLDDPTLLKEVFFLAQGSAGHLYRDWQASADYCGAVAHAFLRARDRMGRDYARELVRDRSLELRARRRFLAGLARELRDRPAELTALLLELHSELRDPEMRRAVVMELLRADPAEGDARAAAFFRSLADEGGPLAALALTGLAVQAPGDQRDAVEDYLLGHLRRSDDPVELRAGAAQAFAPLGRRPGTVSDRVLSALEEALMDPAAEVRYWAARSLGVIGRPATLSVALRALDRETDPACLTALAHTVVRIPGARQRPEVTERLMQAIGERYPSHVRNAFIQALGDLGTDLCRLILEDLSSIAEDPEIRRAASAALVTLRNRDR
jgi:hypothetical protein